MANKTACHYGGTTTAGCCCVGISLAVRAPLKPRLNLSVSGAASGSPSWADEKREKYPFFRWGISRLFDPLHKRRPGSSVEPFQSKLFPSPIMSTVSSQRLKDFIEGQLHRDPALQSELKEKLIQPEEEVVPLVERAMAISPAMSSLLEAGVAFPDGRLVETIVRPMARPVLVIRDNQVTTQFLGPESEVWRGRIQNAQPFLDKVIPAIGRVEVANHPDYNWVGTGWLVAPDIIVTNRHVAREFGRQGSNGFAFKTGLNGGSMTARIDFLEEHQRFTSLEYSLDAILWIAPREEPDVAFLKVTRRVGERNLPPPITLAEMVADEDFVATVGYPARDHRVPDQQLVSRIFGDVYDKKRLAPGQVIGVDGDELEHDCSTLGGNSGSALINLRTGEAVGLHFSGLFLEANFAVAAPKIKDLLRRVQLGEGTVKPTRQPGPAPQAVEPPPTPNVGFPNLDSPNPHTFRFQIPVEITVKIGSAVAAGNGAGFANALPPKAEQFAAALRAAQQALANDSDVVEVRQGFRFKRGWITDERVIVVEVKEKLPVVDLHRAGKPLIPPQVSGVGVDVRTAALPDQLERLGLDLSILEARPRPGLYREPPGLSLTPPIKEKVKAVFHVSPDSGFPNLKAFLGRIKQHATATMYEWDVNHISAALVSALNNNRAELRMVTQFEGTRAAVDDLKAKLPGRFHHAWASVGGGKLFPSAYHIKVASRDGEEVWLSSGNWKDSNQADIDPAGQDSRSMEPLRGHNREWHATIENAKLARLLQNYIEFDFAEAERVPVDEIVAVVFPDVLIQEKAFAPELERAARARYFDPLVVNRELEIQPLLTPDRDLRGNKLFMAHVLTMLQKATRKIYIENQSFNLLEENEDEFEEFFRVVKNKQRDGVDVRIIFRDAREFGRANGPKQQKLLERLKEFGIDTDFIRLQRRCHTKGIIVDSSEVLLGSHNLTNSGSLYNRDASLLIRDKEVAAYFESIFLFDWEVLAVQEADETVGEVRIFNPNEPIPVGFRRVSVAELLS